MIHQAWISTEEVPYWFSRSSVKLISRLHGTKKLSILTWIGRFRSVTPIWIYRWLWNDAQSLKWHKRGAVLFFKVICEISRSHGTKIFDFDPNWAFLDCNSSLNWPMAMKWYTKLELVQKRCPIVFQDHLSNFMFTQGQKFANFDPIWAFPGCNSSFNSLMALK